MAQPTLTRPRPRAATLSTHAGGPPRRASWRRRLALAVAGVLSALLALTAVAAIALLRYVEGGLQREKVAELVDVTGGEPMNVLVLGSDSREGLTAEEQQAQGSPELVGGRRSDTLILVHVDPKRAKAVLLHFPRDLRVAIPGRGEDRINTAYQTGGPSLVVKTVRRLSGLRIHHYVEVDFSGFKKVVDAVGGVRICVDRPMVDRLAHLNLREAGCYNLGGKRALAYVRARHVEGDVIPDFARIARQQQFIRALLNKLLSVRSLLDPSRMRTLAEQVTTDTELQATDIVRLAEALRGLAEGSAGATAVDFRVVPSFPDPEEPAYVIADQAKANELFRRLREGERLGAIGSAQPGTDVSPANVKVMVLDADSGGKAERVERLLLGAGFRVLGITPAPDGVRRAAVLFRPGREERGETVAGYFPNLPMRQGRRISFGPADVVVVVGPNLRGVL